LQRTRHASWRHHARGLDLVTYPAHEAFDADPRVTPTVLRTFAWCRRHLDFVAVREAKLLAVATVVRADRSDVSRALTWLVTAGYLTEHPRQPAEPRRFTLCWSRGDGDGELPTPHTSRAA
jgi:hypothetical protein